MLRQAGDIAASFPQRRHRDWKHIQAVVKIRAEAARSHLRLQVAIGGGDHAHVGMQRARAADAIELTRLQHAQQLRLRLERKFAHLVQEKRTAIGELEASAALLGRAGEGALLVAEELALHQLARQRRTIHRHQRALAAPAGFMNGAGDQFLAGAGFPLNEHSAIRRRDLRDLLAQPPRGRRVAHHVVPHLVDQALDRGARLAMRLDFAPQGDVRADAGEQLLGLEGLGDVIDRAELERAHLLEGIGERGEKDHRDVARRLRLLQALADRVAVHARHHHVEQDEIRPRFRGDDDRLLAARGGDGLVAGGAELLLDEIDV